MFEQVKDYKSACKVLGIKPIDKRRKLEEHVLVYIQFINRDAAIYAAKTFKSLYMKHMFGID